MKKLIDRMGETRKMNCGMTATIIRYSYARDIDVKFEDGNVVYHTCYSNFLKGKIISQAYKTLRLGETRMMNCGLQATIIRYGSSMDIDVKFDDGTVVKHRRYDNFVNGKIMLPSLKLKVDHKALRTGETRMMKCGLYATITRYGSAIDIDLDFEGGGYAKHKQYGNFLEGNISPDKKLFRLGEEKVMNCGLSAIIIRYGSSIDIDVRFKNGAVAKNRTYFDFENGSINNPGIVISRMGEVRIMQCGLSAIIIRYGSSIDIDIKFEDGAVVKHISYSTFKHCKVGHPIVKMQRTFNYHNLVCRHVAGNYEESYYLCECKNCGYKDILPLHQIMLHNC